MAQRQLSLYSGGLSCYHARVRDRAATGLVTGFGDDGDDISVSSRPDALVLFNPVLDTTNERWKQRAGLNGLALSPLHAVREGLPPCLILNGTADTVTPFATAQTFVKEMTASGNECSVVAYDGMEHGFFNLGGYDDTPFRETVREMDRFLVRIGSLDGSTE